MPVTLFAAWASIAAALNLVDKNPLGGIVGRYPAHHNHALFFS
jgi:hypothetical protein